MITLTKQQVIDFINSQPDGRPVDMNEFLQVYSNDCDCLLIHLHRNYFPANKYPISADTRGGHTIIPDFYIELEKPITVFITASAQATTYKQLKKQALTW